MIGAMVALTRRYMCSPAVGLPGPVIVLLGVVACDARVHGARLLASSASPIGRCAAPRLAPLITAIGVSIVLQQVGRADLGPAYIPFPPLFAPNTSYEFGGAIITALQIFIVAVVGADDGGLLVLVHQTKLGRAMRATAQNPDSRRADGRQHQSDHLLHLRSRLGVGRGGRRDGERLLRPQRTTLWALCWA